MTRKNQKFSLDILVRLLLSSNKQKQQHSRVRLEGSGVESERYFKTHSVGVMIEQRMRCRM